MKKSPKWISKSLILAIHERLVAEHGGMAGLIEEGRLESALESPKHHLTYSKADVFGLAAALAHALTRNHPFRDGNKRVVLTAAGVFLALNGFRLDASERDAVVATIALSTGELSAEGFAAWLRESSTAVPGRKATRRRPTR